MSCLRDKCENLALSSLFLDIDECTNNTHKCDVNAVCNNTVGSYKCSCKPGYSGDGKKCTGKFQLLFLIFRYFLIKHFQGKINFLHYFFIQIQCFPR